MKKETNEIAFWDLSLHKYNLAESEYFLIVLYSDIHKSGFVSKSFQTIQLLNYGFDSMATGFAERSQLQHLLISRHRTSASVSTKTFLHNSQLEIISIYTLLSVKWLNTKTKFNSTLENLITMKQSNWYKLDSFPNQVGFTVA